MRVSSPEEPDIKEEAYRTGAPYGLMCELLTHTHRVSRHGFPAGIRLEQAALSPDAYEIACIRTRRPRFSWIVGADSEQHAYQILVADSRQKIYRNEGNVWDSGKVRSGQSVHVEYAGSRLAFHRVYYWKVRTWNAAEEASAYAVTQVFYTGKGNEQKGISRYPLEKREVSPVLIRKREDGYFFIDFGKAAFGTVTIRLSSKEENERIAVHLGEVLQEPYTLHRQPGGARRYRKVVLYLKKGTHTYILPIPPDVRNTLSKAIRMPAYIGEVMPFRYCEVSGYDGEIQQEDIRQIAVNYPFDDEAATFSSSDAVLNDVWALCKYTIKATSFTGMYVDGDRERVPYESDAYINQLGHYCTDREFTMARRSLAYLLKHATWPTEWILHSVLMAYTDYFYTGDISFVRKHYRLLKAKTLLVLARKDGLISTRTGKATRWVEWMVRYDASQFKRKRLRDIVDWPHGGMLGLAKGARGETDGFEFCDINTVVNAFHYRALVLMSRMAKDMDKPKDATFFRERADRVKQSLHDKLFDRESGLYVDGEGSWHSSLHANMFPLAFDMVPQEYKKAVAAFVKSRGMACSVYGAQYLLEALYRAEEDEAAARLLTSTAERSWAHMIYKVGTTITMEAWDDRFKPNQDWNHAWGAVPANIIPRFLMGIRPLEPGFGKLLIQPQPGSIRQAAVKLPTIRGTVEVAFERSPAAFILRLTLPANTQAQVALPFPVDLDFQLRLNDQPVSATRKGKFVVVAPLGGGSYVIRLSSMVKKGALGVRN